MARPVDPRARNTVPRCLVWTPVALALMMPACADRSSTPGLDQGKEAPLVSALHPDYEPPFHAPAEPHRYDGCPDGMCPRDTPALLFSGEFEERAVDLRVPGRGMDFVWARRYRSKLGPNTAQGNGWDYSYNVHVELTEVGGVIVHDGNGRPELFTEQGGQYVAAGYHRVGHFQSGAVFVLTFADTGSWRFRSLSASTAPGKIDAIIDRNGNTMSFSYDTQGRLAQIIDTLGRSYQVAYDANGNIASVTDFTGRRVQYGYYTATTMGGGPGDLATVTLPAIVRTSTGNDFPAGRTTTYTYSKGTGVPALDHNLLTITDATDQTYLRNVYAATTDSADPTFDRLVTQYWGDADDRIDLAYETLDPAAHGGARIRVWMNDREGLVSEHWYDSANRQVRERKHTGRAARDQPTTASTNQPANKLRATDPDFFETVYAYNADHHVTRIEYPSGQVVEQVYQGDIDPNASPRVRGNLRELRKLGIPTEPPCDGGPQVWHYAYAPGFGNEHGDQAFVTAAIEPDGMRADQGFDAAGNLVWRYQAGDPQTREDWTYNAWGQVLDHMHAADASGARRIDRHDYHGTAGGAQRGYLRQIVHDAGGLALTTQFTYDARGNVIRRVDPRGYDTLYEINAANAIVREEPPLVNGVRPYNARIYDANMRMVRVDYLNVDEAGRVDSTNPTWSVSYAHDLLGEVIEIREELAPGVDKIVRMGHDRNRKPVRVRYGADLSGETPGDTEETEWDERGLIYRVTRAPSTAAALVTQTDYDQDGRAIRMVVDVNGQPREHRSYYDCRGRIARTVDAMGNEQRVAHDHADRPIQVERWGELVDLPGAAGNLLLAEKRLSYDAYGRLWKEEARHFDPSTGIAVGDGWKTTTWTFDARGAAQTMTDDRGAVTTFAYDSAGRRMRTIDDAGNVEELTLDEDSNRTKVTRILATASGPLVLSRGESFDPLSEPVQITEPTAAVRTRAQNSRGNLVVTHDARRADPGLPGNEVRHDHDGAGRLLETRYTLTADGTGQGIVIGTLQVSQRYDASDRMVERQDPNGNTTVATYDAAGRMIRKRFPDGTEETLTYDAAGNLIRKIDAAGTRLDMSYDLLDRLVQVVVTPGPGVDGSTTVERYAYDGASHLVEAENDDALVRRGYDSLGNLIREEVDGVQAGFTHDALGALTQVRYPSGRVVDYLRDRLGRLTAITEAGATLVTQSHEGERRLVARGYPAIAAASSFDHDGNGHVIASVHRVGAQTIDQRVYLRDGEGQKEREQELVSGAEHWIGYDSVGRMGRSFVRGTVAVNRNAPYVYDPAGNWLSVGGGPCAGSFVVDGLRHRYDATPCDQRTYTSAGALATTVATAPGGRDRVLTYDHRGRLTRVELPAAGKVVTFAYDALDRVLRTGEHPVGQPAAALVREQRLYHGWKVIEERDDAGATTYTYVYGDGETELLQRASAADGSTLFYFASDTGTVVATVARDSGGQIQREHYEYHDYGAPVFVDVSGQTHASSLFGNDYLFAGMRWLDDVGFYDVRTRYLDPMAGRFLTVDTIGAWGDDAAMGNGYVYVGNQPATSVDVMGTYKTPNFSDFTFQESWAVQHDLKHAEVWANRLRSQIDWVNNKTGNTRRDRYYSTGILRRWFGVYHSGSRFGELRKHVRRIQERIKFDVLVLQYRSIEGACGSGNFSAWTQRDTKAPIVLCRPRYFTWRQVTALDSSIPAENRKSLFRSRILVHEVAHNVGDIRDQQPNPYGFDNATSWANNDEYKAKHSAENFAFAAQDCGGRGFGRCP